MWDFSKLNLKIGSDFVGIKADDEGYAFYLPKGFDDFLDKYQNNIDDQDTNKFDKVRDFFFLMYRALRKFDCDNENNPRVTRKNNKNKTNDQPNLSIDGISLEYQEESNCILYSKLSMIERILEAYDDLTINSLQNKNRSSEEIDYSKIYKYLDKAIYLNNGSIYIDFMYLPRPTICYQSIEIVNIYCFILDEIIQQLQEDVPENVYARSQDIKFLSQKFRDNYLTADHSLFHKDTFEESIQICKEALDNIDRNTHYKDADYWGLYEAVETFLYGGLNPELDDGNFWGVQGKQGFDYVWEDMCQNYFFQKNFDQINNNFNKICFADTDIPIDGYENNKIKNPQHYRAASDKNRVGWWEVKGRDSKLDKFTNQWLFQKQNPEVNHPNNGKALYWRELFCIEWNLNIRHLADSEYTFNKFDDKLLRRYPKPDLIIKNEDSKNIVIIDFKNVSFKKYENYRNKYLEETDPSYRIALEKQLVYELALQQILPEYTIQNYFFIPFYFTDKPKSEKEILGNVESRFTVRGIKIFIADFNVILNVYLGNIKVSNMSVLKYSEPKDRSEHKSRKQEEIILLENQSINSEYVPLISFQNQKQRQIATDYIIEQVKIFFQEIGVDIPNLVEAQLPYSESIVAEEFSQVNIDYFYDKLFYDLGEKKEDRDENGKLKVKIKWCITFHNNSTPIKVPQLKIPGSNLCRSFGTIDIVGTPIFYYIYFTLQELLDIILKN